METSRSGSQRAWRGTRPATATPQPPSITVGYTGADTVAPRVSTIARKTPVEETTNADSLTWTVSFDEAVQNVDPADFSITGSSATVSGVTQGNTAAVWEITVSGGDLAAYNGNVGLALATGQNIQDITGNALSNTVPTGTTEGYTLNNTAPTITITAPSSVSDTTAFPVRIDFDKNVTGFELSDITVVNGTGLNFSGSNGSSRYSIEITPAGTGDITIDIGAGAAQDEYGNDNSAAAQATVSYDATAPGVSSISRKTPAEKTTDADTLTWSISFSEAVQDVDPADFSISGGSSATVSAVTQGNTAAVWDVTASGGDLADYNGDVGLALAANQNIQDLTGNTLTDTTPSGENQGYILNNTASAEVTIKKTRRAIKNFSGNRIKKNHIAGSRTLRLSQRRRSRWRVPGSLP